jgi:hypothetical protein
MIVGILIGGVGRAGRLRGPGSGRMRNTSKTAKKVILFNVDHVDATPLMQHVKKGRGRKDIRDLDRWGWKSRTVERPRKRANEDTSRTAKKVILLIDY